MNFTIVLLSLVIISLHNDLDGLSKTRLNELWKWKQNVEKKTERIGQYSLLLNGW